MASVLGSIASLARIVARVANLAKRFRGLQNLLNRIGGVKNFLKKTYYAAKGKAEGKLYKYISKADFANIKNICSVVGGAIWSALGFGSCFELAKAL
jgi:hypothetical protein